MCTLLNVWGTQKTEYKISQNISIKGNVVSPTTQTILHPPVIAVVEVRSFLIVVTPFKL